MGAPPTFSSAEADVKMSLRLKTMPELYAASQVTMQSSDTQGNLRGTGTANVTAFGS